MKRLVIVESPTKTKTIKQYLPDDVIVDASMGHIRDLPSSAKEVPEKYKKLPWSSLGINVENDFEPLYVIPNDKKKVVKKLKDHLKEVDELILATDEDREGEAISWHLLEVLKPKVPVKRMVFKEITKEAIQSALEETRELDLDLVHAQETRRLLDRLAGYSISPLLWKKIAPGLSAGRVQSVAVALIVARERERLAFRKGTYFDLKAMLESGSSFESQLATLDGSPIAKGKDFDEQTGGLKDPSSVTLLDQTTTEALKDEFEKGTWTVASVDKTKQQRTPALPFITSTLQQEANRKLGLSARDTMSVAQKLYEKGWITYMRTDSPALSDQAVQAAREGILEKYGEAYLAKTIRRAKGKQKSAQEAHEAIRPSGSSFKDPDKTGLSGREYKLYDLIWKRTVAFQMAAAQLEFTNVVVEARGDKHVGEFKASGKQVLFPGFFRAYVEGSDDPEAALDSQDSPLPTLEEGQTLGCQEIEAVGHETKPPARFTEATLVKELEKQGIGRPSTYATIISTIQDRGYAVTEGKALAPTFTAFAVTKLLEEYFPDIVDTDFTSMLEQKLDGIAQGEVDPTLYLRDYYLGDRGLKEVVENQESKIDATAARRIQLPIEGLDEKEILIGRYGPYVRTTSEGEPISASIPNNLTPGSLDAETLDKVIQTEKDGPVSLGKDPETDLDIYVLSGRFGPYLQLGEQTDSKTKPKRVSIPKGVDPASIDFDTALGYLSLPRLVGNHPETGEEIRAGIGRYGPFVVHQGTFKSLTKEDHVLDVSLDRALELLAQAPQRGGGKTVLLDLGKHPEKETAIQVLDGRYGPYIKAGTKNISIPKAINPLDLTLEQALELIKAKEGSKKKKRTS
ncbi:MAG: type I DNA topoisomerase [Balneolaceae bacterium]|nr:type I DNA topoisomerase [Balneolaceae bacterium]MDR9446419.1 type I DNA topoisomerase [Balneolaceae bacterium]